MGPCAPSRSEVGPRLDTRRSLGLVLRNRSVRPPMRVCRYSGERLQDGGIRGLFFTRPSATAALANTHFTCHPGQSGASPPRGSRGATGDVNCSNDVVSKTAQRRIGHRRDRRQSLHRCLSRGETVAQDLWRMSRWHHQNRFDPRAARSPTAVRASSCLAAPPNLCTQCGHVLQCLSTPHVQLDHPTDVHSLGRCPLCVTARPQTYIDVCSSRIAFMTTRAALVLIQAFPNFTSVAEV